MISFVVKLMMRMCACEEQSEEGRGEDIEIDIGH